MESRREKIRPKSPPSLRDVAEQAGVSIMTVSNVINGRTARVGDETRARILAAIEAIGYRPQQRGRSLKLRREFAIGFTIIHPDRRFLDDPYPNAVAAGLSNALSDLGFGLMINGVQTVEALEATVARVANVDGIAIMASGPLASRIRAYSVLAKLHHPLVIVQDPVPDDITDASSVMQDDTDGAFKLTRLLIERGARTILLVVPRYVWPAIDRRRAGVIAAAGGDAVVTVIECDETDFEATTASISTWLAAHDAPDAIMGANDQIALSALRAVRRSGRAVPQDVMVTGFNAFAFRQFASPLITSVTSPAYSLGEEIARLLIRRVDTGSFDRRQILLPVAVAPGESIRAAAP